MTLSKASLGEALAEEAKPYPAWEVVTNPDLVAAARFVERLLPGKCDPCEAALGHEPWQHDSHACKHEDCHGTGQLWDEGLVEVVRQAAINAIDDGSWDSVARAVLAVLAGEVGR